MVGPTGNASVMPALEPYGEAALALLTVSALAVSFGVADRRSFFQASPLSLGQGSAVNMSLAKAQGARRLGILCDRDGDAEGWQASVHLARTLALFAADATLYPRVVPRGPGEADLEPVVADLLAQRLDGLFYTGTPAGAAKVAVLLAAAGFRGRGPPISPPSGRSSSPPPDRRPRAGSSSPRTSARRRPRSPRWPARTGRRTARPRGSGRRRPTTWRTWSSTGW